VAVLIISSNLAQTDIYIIIIIIIIIIQLASNT